MSGPPISVSPLVWVLTLAWLSSLVCFFLPSNGVIQGFGCVLPVPVTASVHGGVSLTVSGVVTSLRRDWSSRRISSWLLYVHVSELSWGQATLSYRSSSSCFTPARAALNLAFIFCNSSWCCLSRAVASFLSFASSARILAVP